MNTKSIMLIACLAWTASQYASDAHKQLAAFNYVAQLVNKAPNIFEDQFALDAIKRRISDTDFWLKTELKKYKSDTLEKIMARTKTSVSGINNELNRFSTNLDMMKRDMDEFKKYKMATRNFSKDRDALKNQLKSLGSFKTVRMAGDSSRDQAKVEIANVLNAYVETFIAIAQKAINDFAAMDAALFRKENMGKQGMERIPSATITGSSGETIKAYADVPDRDSGTWSDWDSE